MPFKSPPSPCAAYMSNENQESTQESSLQIDLLAWYEVNKRNVFVGFGLIVVAFGATLVFNHQREAKVINASRDLMLLLTPGKGDDQAPDPAKLIEVANKHSGAPAAAHASLLAGRELFTAGKYAEARAQFDKVASNDGVLGAIAAYGIAACIDAEKGGNEALTAYQSVITHPKGDLLAGRARLAKARIHESLKQNKEALALYDEIAKDSKDRQLASDAFVRRATLLRANPELNKAASLTNSVNVVPAVKPTP